ncbi:MAG: response regulator transcription factor [Actinotignum sanguinis]|uniref:response regulator transcription factor n=1 Tax=Actinotignum sanguinis TaxID=1445614 RepID=UPI00237E2E39|nr:response regulator transcription factor [Actinotignum sanguinis]MDE1553784.1 response regulator transcription factor [Actinotignum sanguinis]MDE1566467.1 response regulator transcription factor [Actinotignum sanguinis]MDE1578068.1 response regulator transcription factor [Actinotignum sanguinis]MDK8287532.1 response regulator transcription factor [Actinotignum sanguinis]MDK8651923.1 response regulator transcription factor [Actinotignum sanguinis]
MRLVVADDSALFREGLCGLLERRGHNIVATAATAPELNETVRAATARGEAPDLVITDVRMPPTMSDDGLRAAVELRREFPSLGIMVLSQYVAPAYARELFHPAAGAGASGSPATTTADANGDDAPGGLGYLLKDRVARVADFVRSLEIVGVGGVVVDPDVAAQLMATTPSLLTELTSREREILELMARGYANSAIAAELYLTGATVSKHVANIFLKLGMQPGEENRRVRAVLAYLTETSRAG